MTTYIHPADPRRDTEMALHHILAAHEQHLAGNPHDTSVCDICELREARTRILRAAKKA